ncbi:MAG TPA: hypothetical protein VHS78_02610 [Candidatus Elarobacter sp.]|nr:hypothetical protein [Candidatus Elarobacter sp.]
MPTPIGAPSIVPSSRYVTYAGSGRSFITTSARRYSSVAVGGSAAPARTRKHVTIKDAAAPMRTIVADGQWTRIA